MKNVRLIYASTLTPAHGPNDMNNILLESRRNNPAFGVTGLLCYDIRHFLQWLEGPRDAVNELYAKILPDSRHEKVTLLDYADIDESEFGEWSMAVVSAREATASILNKYFEDGVFDPYKLRGVQSRFLMIELAQDRSRTLADEINALSS